RATFVAVLPSQALDTQLHLFESRRPVLLFKAFPNQPHGSNDVAREDSVADNPVVISTLQLENHGHTRGELARDARIRRPPEIDLVDSGLLAQEHEPVMVRDRD